MTLKQTRIALNRALYDIEVSLAQGNDVSREQFEVVENLLLKLPSVVRAAVLESITNNNKN